MWRVAPVRSVRLRVTGVNDSIETGLIGPAGVRRRAGGWCAGRHNARERRLLRPKRMGARVVFGAFLRSGGLLAETQESGEIGRR